MRFAAFILCVLLSACGISSLSDSIGKSPEATYLHEMVANLAARDYGAIEQAAVPELMAQNLHGALEQMSAFLPTDTIQRIDPVNFSLTYSSDKKRFATIAEQYTFSSNQHVVISAQLVGEPGNFRISAFYIEPLTASVEELNAFTFKGKGFTHYAFITLMLSAVLLCLYAFIQCLRTPGLKRKWLWAIFTLFGCFAFTINWTSGAVAYQLLVIQFFGGAVHRVGLQGPWLLSFAIPVGAIWFLLKRRLMLRDAQDAAIAPSEAQSQAPTN